MRLLLCAAVVSVGLCTAAAAQQPTKPAAPAAPTSQRPATPPATPPPTTQTPAAPPRPRPRAPAPVTASVVVRDRDGSPIEGVKVSVSGTASQQVTTGRDGTASLGPLKDG